jgi:hypothetical protein
VAAAVHARRAVPRSVTPDAIAIHERTIQREGVAGRSQSDVRGEIGDGGHHSSSLVSSAVGKPSATHSFF